MPVANTCSPKLPPFWLMVRSATLAPSPNMASAGVRDVLMTGLG